MRNQERTIRANGSLRIQTHNSGKSRVQQQFKDDTDINLIMKKYEQGIMPTHLATGPGFYGDFTEIKSYEQALNALDHADQAFNLLPATIRAQFQNDPHQLTQFLANPNNLEAARDLGLISRPPILSNANDDSTTNANKPKAKAIKASSPQLPNSEE